MTTEYRIEFSIQRGNGNGDFAEIGFGSSGTWEDLDTAAHMVNSVVQNQDWETGPDMPDPASISVFGED
jgi:hypothetical protein